MNHGDIENSLSVMEKDIAKLDEFLLATGRPQKDNTIIGNLHDLKRKVIRLHLMIDLYEYNHKTIEKSTNNRLTKINQKIVLLDSYNSMIIKYKQKKTLDILALVSLIFLPLSLITGYFGMNFVGMGTPLKKTGIFSISKPNYFVMVLFAISIVVMGVLFFNFNH